MGPEFTVALDRCGWMIVPQPQFGDRRWFMNHPSDACPERPTMTCLKRRRRCGPAGESSMAARARHRWPEPQRESSSRASLTENGRIVALKLNSGLLQIDRLVAAVLVELSAPYLV
jgi:hypothetical protein